MFPSRIHLEFCFSSGILHFVIRAPHCDHSNVKTKILSRILFFSAEFWAFMSDVAFINTLSSAIWLFRYLILLIISLFLYFIFLAISLFSYSIFLPRWVCFFSLLSLCVMPDVTFNTYFRFYFISIKNLSYRYVSDASWGWGWKILQKKQNLTKILL